MALTRLSTSNPENVVCDLACDEKCMRKLWQIGVCKHKSLSFFLKEAIVVALQPNISKWLRWVITRN